MLISIKLLTKWVVIIYTFGSVHEKFIFGILRSLTSFSVLKTLTGSVVCYTAVFRVVTLGRSVA